jgi:hypothetical protein
MANIIAFNCVAVLLEQDISNMHHDNLELVTLPLKYVVHMAISSRRSSTCFET